MFKLPIIFLSFFVTSNFAIFLNFASHAKNPEKENDIKQVIAKEETTLLTSTPAALAVSTESLSPTTTELTPTPSPTVTPTQTTTIAQESKSEPTTSLDHEQKPPSPTFSELPTEIGKQSLMQEINSYRTSMGKTAFENHPTACSFAEIRALELKTDFSHNGFDERVKNGTLPYPSYSQISENIAFADSFMRVLEMWKKSESHNRNLLSGSKYACIASSGNYYAFESWSP